MATVLSSSAHARSLAPAAANALAGFSFAFALAACICANAMFVDVFNTRRFAVVLVLIAGVLCTVVRRAVVPRESKIYTAFFLYMLLQLAWTSDVQLARNTLVPAFNFPIILALAATVVTCFPRRSVVLGFLGGSLFVTAMYCAATGFPFVRPDLFSYNAIAMASLFALFSAVFCAVTFPKSRLVLLAIPFTWIFVVMTTSIKTNLGIVLGATVVGVFRYGLALRWMTRNVVLILAAVAIVAGFLATNDGASESAKRGFERITLGVRILQAGEALPGYGALDRRRNWTRIGIENWRENPVFGHGVEGFRSRFGTTSHTTLVDLLYNSGVIGFILFYSVFVSMFWRVFFGHRVRGRAENALILGFATCLLFVTVSGTMHYNAILAAIIGVGAALLRGGHAPSSDSDSGPS